MSRFTRTRDTRSLKRRAGTRTPRSITLIVCEGETEQGYLDALRLKYGLSTAEVIVADNTEGAAPISVVACAEKRCRERGGYDHVFCVFDRDGHESFARAKARVNQLRDRKQKPLPIQSITSIPCFEFWALLHFKKTDAPFANCNEVIEQLKKADRLPNYVKADAATISKLLPLTDTAVANAEWLALQTDVNQGNPSTSMHHLVRHFSTVAAQQQQ